MTKKQVSAQELIEAWREAAETATVACAECGSPRKRAEAKTALLHARTLEEAPTTNKNEKKLRQLLWLHHECPHRTLYGDDGEMQCNNPSCMIDFKRMSPDEIKDNWTRRGQALIEKALWMEAVLAKAKESS